MLNPEHQGISLCVEGDSRGGDRAQAKGRALTLSSQVLGPPGVAEVCPNCESVAPAVEAKLVRQRLDIHTDQPWSSPADAGSVVIHPQFAGTIGSLALTPHHEGIATGVYREFRLLRETGIAGLDERRCAPAGSRAAICPYADAGAVALLPDGDGRSRRSRFADAKRWTCC